MASARGGTSKLWGRSRNAIFRRDKTWDMAELWVRHPDGELPCMTSLLRYLQSSKLRPFRAGHWIASAETAVILRLIDGVEGYVMANCGEVRRHPCVCEIDALHVLQRIHIEETGLTKFEPEYMHRALQGLMALSVVEVLSRRRWIEVSVQVLPSLTDYLSSEDVGVTYHLTEAGRNGILTETNDVLRRALKLAINPSSH
jgi:hypothetical protein